MAKIEILHSYIVNTFMHKVRLLSATGRGTAKQRTKEMFIIHCWIHDLGVKSNWLAVANESK